MRIASTSSRRNNWWECGVPVDNELKTRLRNRSTHLTPEQLESLKKMGINLSRHHTEKDAARVAKRVCGARTNYVMDETISSLHRAIKKAKPKRITRRAHAQNMCLYASAMGSNNATKKLN